MQAITLLISRYVRPCTQRWPGWAWVDFKNKSWKGGILPVKDTTKSNKQGNIKCWGSLCWNGGQYSRWFLFSSVQMLSRVWLFATLWITARQASLSITNSRSSLRLTSIESGMPSSHLILCCPRLLLPPIPPSIRVFSNESTLLMRWPKYWSFSFSIIPSKEHPGLPSLSPTDNWFNLH